MSGSLVRHVAEHGSCGDAGGAASEYLKVNRGSWWDGDLAYFASAAGAMFACVFTHLSLHLGLHTPV